MQKYQFTSIDRLLAKFHRDMKNNDIDEADIIEWTGEALAHAMTPGSYEEVVKFEEVRNHQINIPNGLGKIIQIAKNNGYNVDDDDCKPKNVVKDKEDEESPLSDDYWLQNAIPVDSDGTILGDYDVAYYRPFFDYNNTYYEDNYVPVRLADNSFFKSIVQSEYDTKRLLNTRPDDPEYTIVQDKIRFSFETGLVAISYYRIPTDIYTGYPKIPDDQSIFDLLVYYVTYKIKEGECFNHKQGACQLADRADHKFQSSLREFIAKTKMPSTIDEKENLKRLSNSMIPQRNMSDNFFGNLNKDEMRRYTAQNKTRNR